MHNKTDINLEVRSTANHARKSCAARLTALLLAHSERNVCLLISGGSALTVLNDMSHDHVGPRTTFCVVDERFHVERGDRNYDQLLHNTYVHDAVAVGARVIDTRLDAVPSLAAAQEVFQRKLYEVLKCDVVVTLLGIGPDGHTAGIMPFPESQEYFEETFYDENRSAVGYDAGDKNQFPLRVTASSTFLQEATDHTVVYVVGQEKKSVLADILASREDEYKLPARLIHRMKDVTVFTDQGGV